MSKKTEVSIPTAALDVLRGKRYRTTQQVYCALWRHANGRRTISPRSKLVAHTAGLSPRTVLNHIQTLQDMGLACVTTEPGKPKAITLHNAEELGRDFTDRFDWTHWHGEEPPPKPEPIGGETHRAMFGKLLDYCIDSGGQHRAAMTGKHARLLLEAGYTPDQLDIFAAWWKRHDFRGRKGQKPSLTQVHQLIQESITDWEKKQDTQEIGSSFDPIAIAAQQVEDDLPF